MDETLPIDLVTPPQWALLVGTIGRFCILASVGMFALSAIAWLFSQKQSRLVSVGKLSFNLACCTLLGSFVTLGVLFSQNRFEYSYVYGHADTHNALAYRIAGIWSGQEGSFLLWACCAAVFALFTVRASSIYRRWYSIALAFFLGGLASILAFESPFNLNLAEGKPFVPAEGLGLAPSLQNYWVVIHPPTIFFGFGSLTALFALAFAALVERDYETWVRIVRPWALVSVSVVGLGLCMGGFWAYETLGWGGFWMWDPVENVSFVPWCFATAFIHGVLVQVARNKWQMSNLLLGGLPFLVFIYGTFLTRSGFLSDASVHSFAEMDRSALKLLITLMAVATIGSVGLWCTRCYQMPRQPAGTEATPGLKREAFFMIGITTLIMMGVATMIGMSVPFIQSLKGQKPKVVEEGLYHQVLPWVFVPLMLMMAVTPLVSWRGTNFKTFGSKIYSVLSITIGLAGLLLLCTVRTSFGKLIDINPLITMFGNHQVHGLSWLMVLVGICILVLVANSWKIYELFRRSKMGSLAFFAHMGVAVLMAGLIISRGFEQKGRSIVMEDHPAQLLNYEVRYRGMTLNEQNRDNKLALDVYEAGRKGAHLFTATPGLYRVAMPDGQENTMVWPFIRRGWLMDTYVSIGQPQRNASEDSSVAVGGSTQIGGMTITYQKMTRVGEFGQPGTKFGALVTISANGASKVLNPTMEIGAGGKPIFHTASIDKHMELAMVGMNAADRSVTLRVQLTTPIYPIEIYHKPMTMLVWLGTGMMTASGLSTAYYRRVRKVSPVPVKQNNQNAPRAGDFATSVQGEKL